MCTAIKEMIEEGREEGREDMIKLTGILLRQNRIDDLKRAVDDSEYRNQLIREMGL